MKTIIVIATLLCLTGCSGFRYSITEDNNAYFLKGEHYNNNPFIYTKAIIPDSYLVRKTSNKTASKEDIKSTNNYGTKIIEGVIIDQATAVEIRLTVHDGISNLQQPARENGTYILKSRTQVDDINEFLNKHEKDIFEKLRP